MRIRIERTVNKSNTEEYRIIRVSGTEKKPVLSVVGTKFENNGVVPDHVFEELTTKDREFIVKNLPRIISRISNVGSF